MCPERVLAGKNGYSDDADTCERGDELGKRRVIKRWDDGGKREQKRVGSSGPNVPSGVGHVQIWIQRDKI